MGKAIAKNQIGPYQCTQYRTPEHILVLLLNVHQHAVNAVEVVLQLWK